MIYISIILQKIVSILNCRLLSNSLKIKKLIYDLDGMIVDTNDDTVRLKLKTLENDFIYVTYPRENLSHLEPISDFKTCKVIKYISFRNEQVLKIEYDSNINHECFYEILDLSFLDDFPNDKSN